MKDDDLNLFGDPPAKDAHAGRSAASSGADPADVAMAPLAARMRPRTLDDYVGQEHLLGPGKALRELIEKDAIGSVIFWGPPGTGYEDRGVMSHLKAPHVGRRVCIFCVINEEAVHRCIAASLRRCSHRGRPSSGC